MNRYTSITPSQFSPLSLEEIMLVPSMKRKQHDDILAKQEILRAELAKVDPLDVHLDEAVKLREEMNNKLTAQAEQLANSGIDPNSQGQFLALNREYQNLTGPTGRLGQINRAKQLRDAERARYLEAASKQYGSTRALELWNKYEKEYTGYEDPEKSKIKYIDSRGIVGAQNFDEDLKLYHSLLGQTQTSASNSGYKIVDSGQGDGSKVMVNSSGQVVHSDNINQLNEQRKLLDAKWLNETGEGFKYNQESGIDLNNFRNRFSSAINMQKETSDMSKYDVDGNFISGPSGNSNGNNTTPVGIFDPTSQKTIGQDSNEIDFSKIGSSQGTGVGQNVGVKGYSAPAKIYTYKDVISDPITQRAYKVTFDNMIKNGELPKNSNINSKDVALKIQKKFKSGEIKVPTIGNDIIMADVTPNSQMFMGELANKDEKSRNALIQNQLDAGLRTMIDPVSGEELTPDEFREKGYRVEYIGYDSPVNYRGYNFKGDNRNVQTTMAHKVNIYDKDGNSLGQAPVTRSAQEVKDPNFQKAYQIAHIYRNAANNFNDWVKPTNIKNTKVKFKDNGLFDIEYNGKIYSDLNNSQYQIILDEIMTKQSE